MFRSGRDRNRGEAALVPGKLEHRTLLRVDINLETLLKFYGPLGLIIFVLLMAIWRWLIPRMDKRDEEYKSALMSIVDDARKERDYERQSRAKEVDTFVQTVRFQSEQARLQLEKLADSVVDRRHESRQ